MLPRGKEMFSDACGNITFVSGMEILTELEQGGYITGPPTGLPFGLHSSEERKQ